MYLYHLTHIMKQSALHLIPALAALSLDDDTVTNDMDDALPGITPLNIDNLVLAALDSVESAINSAAFPIYFKQDNVHPPQITQASADINYFCQTGRSYADVSPESYPYSTNWNDCAVYSELHSILTSGATIRLYNDVNYSTLTYRYNNLVFLCTDYLAKTSPVINADICCKVELKINMADDVFNDNLDLTDTMFFSNGDVYIYSDKNISFNDNCTININLNIESTLSGDLKLTASDILFKTCGGKNIPVSGVILLTGENSSFFIIRFNGSSNFIVTFENTGKIVNWVDIA